MQGIGSSILDAAAEVCRQTKETGQLDDDDVMRCDVMR